MALETLRDLQTIGETAIYQVAESGTTNRPDAVDCHIHVYHNENKIQFQIQQGPIKENGVNGCQVDDIIGIARQIIHGLNQNFPCRENSCAITKLDEALHWLKARTADREKRGVEGHNKE